MASRPENVFSRTHARTDGQSTLKHTAAAAAILRATNKRFILKYDKLIRVVGQCWRGTTRCRRRTSGAWSRPPSTADPAAVGRPRAAHTVARRRTGHAVAVAARAAARPRTWVAAAARRGCSGSRSARCGSDGAPGSRSRAPWPPEAATDCGLSWSITVRRFVYCF